MEKHGLYNQTKTNMIETFKIKTGMGKCREKLPFLSEEEMKELDSIGYSGKTTKGERMSRVGYLNSLNKGEFDIKQTKHDNGDFLEEFIIVRVSNEKTKNMNLKEHLEGLSLKALVEISMETENVSFPEESEVRKLVSMCNANDFMTGLLELKTHLLSEITKRCSKLLVI